MAITITPHGNPGGGRVDVTINVNGRTFQGWAKGDTSWLFQPATRSISFQHTKLFTGPPDKNGNRPTTDEAHAVYRVSGLKHILLHGPVGSRGCLAIQDFEDFRAAVGNRATIRITGRGRDAGPERDDDEQDRGFRVSRREQSEDRGFHSRSQSRGSGHNPFEGLASLFGDSGVQYNPDADERRAKRKPQDRDRDGYDDRTGERIRAKRGGFQDRNDNGVDDREERRRFPDRNENGIDDRKERQRRYQYDESDRVESPRTPSSKGGQRRPAQESGGGISEWNTDGPPKFRGR